MITSRKPPRYRDLLVYALIISVLIHILVGSLIPRASRIMALTTKGDSRIADTQEPASIIRLERRRVPAPVVRAPRPVIKHVEHELLPVIPKLPRPIALGMAGASTRVADSTPYSRHELARTTKNAPSQAAVTSEGEGTPQVGKGSGYTSDQIAQIESKFSKTIADSRTDIQTVTDQVQDTPVAPKHYSMQFNGIHGDINIGDGTLYPVQRGEVRGDRIWYYVRYEYRYGDGHVEQDYVPWPFSYPVNDDPFRPGQRRRLPLQAPPEGYKRTRQLAPLLMQFFGGPDPGR